MVLFLFLSVAFVAVNSQSYASNRLSSTYPSNAWMNEQKTFRLWWKYIPQNIAQNIYQDMFQFAMEAQTTGWVGMGISPNGQMPSSDIAIGWVDGTGNVFIEDRNSFAGKTTPAVDSLQNVTLVCGEEYNGWTIVEFKRPKMACESNDSAIPVGSSRIIFAYSPSNKDGPNIDYHQPNTQQRGSKTLNLDSTGRPLPPKPADAQTIDLLFSNYPVPSVTTTYACQLFELPTLPNKVHIVEIQPNIPINKNVVHHTLLYACPIQHNPAFATGKSSYANLLHPHECRTHNMITIKECYNGLLIAAWAVGGGGIVFPNVTGYPIGGGNPNTSIQWVMMETHYDNPLHINGIVDASGLTLSYTPTLRQYDATVVWGGLPVSNVYQWIPPASPPGTLLWNSAYVPGSCLAAAMDARGVTSVNVIFSFLHMHQLGRAIKIRHFRNGTELKPIDDNPNYDFNFQQTVPVDVVLQRGDELLLECGYSSSGVPTAVSYAGTASAEEMCMFFFTLYPALDLQYVASLFPNDANGQYRRWLNASRAFLTYTPNGPVVTSYNLSYPGALQAYQDLYNTGNYVSQRTTNCRPLQGSPYSIGPNPVPWITINQPYVPPSQTALCQSLPVMMGVRSGMMACPASPTQGPNSGTTGNTASGTTVAPPPPSGGMSKFVGHGFALSLCIGLAVFF